MSEVMDPAKLKVVELRAELTARGLDSRGNKACLVDRLKEALEQETGKTIADSSIVDTSSEDIGADTSVSNEKEMDEPASKENSSPSKESTEVGSAETKPVPNIKEEPVKDTPMTQPPKQPEAEMKKEPEVKVEKDKAPETPVSQDGRVEKVEVKDESGRAPEVKAEKESAPPKTETTRNDAKEESRDHRDNDRRAEKRRRSPSPGYRGRSPQRRDDEPDYDENAVLLSWYDSDLNLMIDKAKFSLATPMYEQGFGYIWAGARASHGVTSGRTCFEVMLLENCDVSHLEDEPTPHVLRVGWSTILTSMQLGEEPHSFGYGGTGKASTDCKFKNYGKPFMAGDVVGAFLDMNSDPIVMSFSVNGEPQGVAYEIARSTLEGNALYPHVLTKNVKFECNFGNQDPWFPLLPGYTLVGQVPVDQRVPGPRRPEKRSDCEMIMMCGLPACGKTTWANEWYSKNLTKNYNILGSNNLIDKMKVMGLPRKRNYAGRWDVLINRCMNCLSKLLDIASRRRRNYILDQTNVYPSAQRRKMRGFEGFVRRAVVIVPTDEEFKKRIEKQEKVEGKDVPDSAVLEMKANFMLPEKGDIFNEVIYTELGEEEARALVQKYNAEARDAGVRAQHKRPRLDNRDRDRPSFRGGFRPRGGSGGPPDRNRSGGWQSRGGGGGGGGRGGGGWRDRQASSGGFRSGGSSSGGGGGGGGGGWRGNRDVGSGGRGHDSHGSRGFDRNRSGGNSNRSQSSGGKSNWGGSYNQGGGNWDSSSNTSGGGGGGGGGGSGSGSGSSNWGQQNYNQQGWGQQGGYSQQGWKGGYNQQSGGNYGQGAYNQQSSYGGNSNSGTGTGSQQGYNSGNAYQNWNQPYYNQYGSSGQGWSQGNTDNSYSGGNYAQQQQQGTWQGYGQGYNYGGSNQQAQQGGGGGYAK